MNTNMRGVTNNVLFRHIQNDLSKILKFLPLNIISWRTFWASLPISMLVAPLLIAPKGSSVVDLAKWTAIAIFSHLCMAPFVFYVKDKNNLNLQIFFSFAMGAIRGGVIGLSAPLLGLTDLTPIPARMANSAIAVFYWLQVLAIYFDVKDYYQKKVREFLHKIIFEMNLESANNYEVSGSLTSKSKILVLIANLKEEIELNSKPDQSGSFKVQIQAIDDLIEEHIKPASAKKWQDSELIWPKFSFLKIFKKSLEMDLIPVIGIILLTLPFSAFGNIVRYGIFIGLAALTFSASLTLAINFTLNSILIKNVSKFKKNIYFLVSWSMISAPLNIVFLRHFTIERNFLLVDTIQIVLLSSLLFLAFIFAATALSSLKVSRNEALDLLGNLIPQNQLESFMASGFAAKSAADLAQYLHAEVQAQLHACKLLLLRASESDFKLFSPNVTQMVVNRLEMLGHSYTKTPSIIPRERMLEISHSWRGLAAIDLELPVEFNTFSRDGEVATQLIEEVIVNSIRHGKAKFIKIVATISDSICNVVISNDGQLKNVDSTGLGGTLFATFTNSWNIEEVIDGTRIRFTIPFDFEASADNHV